MATEGAFLPIGWYGSFPQHLREQFEGVIWRFRSGRQRREMPEEFGTWQTIYDRFAQWRDIGVFAALMEVMIAEAARRGQADMSLVSVDSTVTRTHHGAAGMVVEPERSWRRWRRRRRRKGAAGTGQITPVAVDSPSGGPSGLRGGGCASAAGPGSRKRRWAARAVG